MSGSERTLPDSWVWRWIIGPAIYVSLVAFGQVLVLDASWGSAIVSGLVFAVFITIVASAVTRARDR